MAQYIYSRVSTDDQSTDSQTHALLARYPYARVVSETASGAKSRPMLAALLEQLEPGDELIVFGLDRLGRRTAEVLNLLEALEKRGVNFISQREGVDFRTPVGKLVLSILAAVATMEREMLRERTKAGLASAKAQGRVGGRPQRIPAEDLEGALAMVAAGASVRQAAREFGISHSRIRYEQKKRATL
jgi:DNA invertase Pin-like site-specific DNA recombinase